ncbi:MAG TPA: hypothetical protein VHK24_14000, partial [Steroidobacter sp.]|nr:hypothetical protein [Steroidobacter sp.]
TSGCVSIPSEAPELSAQLGSRVSAMEAAHRRLVTEYFSEKRRQIDEFVQEEWVPVFAAEFFSDHDVENVWDQVVASNNPSDRLKFILIAGPKLQATINSKRTELIRPIDQLETAVQQKLADEYNGMRAINGTLTAFLQSASEVDTNRKRYLDMLGVSDKTLTSYIDEVDTALSALVDKTDDASTKVKESESFIKRLEEIAKKLRT